MAAKRTPGPLMHERSADAIAARRADVVKLHAQGLTSKAIALRLGVTRNTVTRDLTEARRSAAQ